MRTVRTLVLMIVAVCPQVAAAQTSLILGAVEDSAGRAIPDVQVTVMGSDALIYSDASGRFRLGPLRASTYLLQFRRLGFAPATALANVRAADTLRLAIELAVASTTLATVSVTAESSTAHLEQVGFVRRRRDATVPRSRFVSRAEFESRPPPTMSDLLRRMGSHSNSCPKQAIFVDGALLVPPLPTDPKPKLADPFGEAMKRPAPVDVIPPSSVDAVEVYLGPAEIPLEFKAAGRGFACVVLIWTRDR